MQHELKTLPQYFKEVANGNKTFELRKNDRGFKVDDTLLLKECSITGTYSGQEITKEVTYILEGGQYGLEEGHCILGLKEPINSIGNCARCGRTIINHEECDCKRVPVGIELKNIDLTGISIKEQKDKVKEERYEFGKALNDYADNRTEKTKKHLIEEYYDMIQAPLGLLEKEGISAEEVQRGYPLHEKKLLKRPRKKECKKCIEHENCKLYFSENWNGEKEAETCKIYKEQEE